MEENRIPDELDEVLETVESALADLDADAQRTIVENLATDVSGLHGTNLVMSVINLFHLHLSGRDKRAAKEKLELMVTEVFARPDPNEDPILLLDYNAENQDFGPTYDPNRVPPLQLDAMNVFRSLCKLAGKKVPSDEAERKLVLRTKAVSMELLLLVMEQSAALFRTDHFSEAIKRYMCPVMLQNCVSSVIPVFKASLALFNTLHRLFRDFLKVSRCGAS